MKGAKNTGTERIRRTHRGFRFDIWIAHGESGAQGRDTYNYKATTPTGVVFEGKGYQPQYSAYGSREMIMDGLLEIICAVPDGTKAYTIGQLAWLNSAECTWCREQLTKIPETV